MIRVEDLWVEAGAFALRGVSFTVPSACYGVLMGPTGCGKTTLLEALCGLRPVKRGRVCLNDAEVTALPPRLRGIGYVPQDGALFGALTVRQHLAFALEIRAAAPPEVAARVTELAGLLGLAPLLDRLPAGLSGGERQRVALGRALAARPQVICLDEPLNALDESTHAEMCQLLRAVRDATGATVLHVTHSPTEAKRLGDRRFVFRDGRILEEPAAA